ncbi:MAG: glutathione S-transferase family protein [Parasphingorhabdus sp.]
MPVNPDADIEISAFKWVPDFAQGFVRDLRPRWACEEIGLDYAERLIGPEEQASDSYRREQPFGQVPVLNDDGVSMFESGAILLNLAEKDEHLLAADPQQRASTISWLFAAFNSIEPMVFELGNIDLFSKVEEWAQLRRPGLIESLGGRLDQMAKALGDKDYLVGDFSVADIAMSTTLRETERAGMLEQRPALSAYLARCIDRPAFKRALKAQMVHFTKNEPQPA